MTRSVAQKMMLKAGMSAFLHNAPLQLLDDIEAPDLEVKHLLNGKVDYLHLFSTKQGDLAVQFNRLKSHLAAGGSLWVSWPKGKGLGTDLNLHEVIRIGYAQGLVESTCLSIDSTWSALRFTHPKPGKTYKNSHAVLVRD